jgi:hypothetical protein
VKVGATGSTRLQRDTPDLEDDLGVRSFLPNGDFLVSSCIIPREDAVSQGRNSFLSFSSLPSFISLPCHLFAEVASHLLKIETTINVSLGLPL